MADRIVERSVLALVCLAGVAVSALAFAEGQSPRAARAKELSGVVNLNTATAAELELLPGIGGRTAAAIVAWREKHPFKSVGDIVRVKGIGPGIFKRIKLHLAVNGPTNLRWVAAGESAGGATPVVEQLQPPQSRAPPPHP